MCVYRPGERDVAYVLFDLMGLKTIHLTRGRRGLCCRRRSADIPGRRQRQLRRRARRAGRSNGPSTRRLKRPCSRSRSRLPSRSSRRCSPRLRNGGCTSVSRLNSPADWEAAVARIRDVDDHPSLLRGRVRLLKAFRPGDPDQPFNLYQAFVLDRCDRVRLAGVRPAHRADHVHPLKVTREVASAWTSGPRP